MTSIPNGKQQKGSRGLDLTLIEKAEAIYGPHKIDDASCLLVAGTQVRQIFYSTLKLYQSAAKTVNLCAVASVCHSMAFGCRLKYASGVLHPPEDSAD